MRQSNYDVEMGSLKWGWVLVIATAFLVLGMIAIMLPVASTLGVTLTVASLVLAAGAIQFVHAVQQRHERNVAWRFIQSLLAVVTGGLMLRYPSGGMMAIALTLGFYFFIEGSVQAAIYWDLRKVKGSGWAALSSAASFLLGIFTVFTFPWSALWLPGTLLGINMISTSVGLFGLGIALKASSSRPRSERQHIFA